MQARRITSVATIAAGGVWPAQPGIMQEAVWLVQKESNAGSLGMGAATAGRIEHDAAIILLHAADNIFPAGAAS
ncbi:MAG: hypothetical protein ACTHJQ_11595 [Rhizobiaceae bacterium]